MGVITGPTRGTLRSYPAICSHNLDFSRTIRDRRRNIARNPRSISRIPNRKEGLMFGILDLEYLVFYPWVIQQAGNVNSREFLFCPVSSGQKIQVEKYFLQEKSRKSASREQPGKKEEFRHPIPVSPNGAGGAGKGVPDICPGMSGILSKKQMLSSISHISIPMGLFPNILSSEAFSLMNYVNMKSRLPEMHGTIPFSFLSGKRNTDVSKKPDKDLVGHKGTYYQHSTPFAGTGTNYERNRAFIRHVRSFSYDNTANEINNNNGSDGNDRSRFTPEILLAVPKWMIAAADRERLSHRGFGISRDRMFTREVPSQPKTGSIQGQLLNRILFAGNMKDKDKKASSGLLSAASEVRPFVLFSHPSGNSARTSIQHRITEFPDPEKKPYPEIGMESGRSMERTGTGDRVSQIKTHGEYVPVTPQISRSNMFFPDDYPDKGNTNKIDPYSTMAVNVERERYERNKLNQLRKTRPIRRTAKTGISHPFTIDHRIPKKRNPVTGSSRIILNRIPIPGIPISGTPKPGTPKPGTPKPGTSIPGTPIPGTSIFGTSIPGTSIPGTPIPGTSIFGTSIFGTSIPGTSIPGTPIPGTPKPGTSIPGIPKVFGEVPLSSSLLLFEHRKSSPLSRSGPMGEQEEDFMTRTQRTHPVHMELVRMNDTVPQEVITMKNDMVKEGRPSSLTTSTDMMHIDIHYLTEQVYQKLEKKIRIERERRGM